MGLTITDFGGLKEVENIEGFMLAICLSTFSILHYISIILKNTFKLLLLLARLESAYSLV